MICLIYSTHPSAEQARQTADSLLNETLAACCNILPGAESHYVWEGERQVSAEWVMLSKTSETQAHAVMHAIRAQHPYDNPAILQIPLNGGNPTFLAWVEKTIKTTR